MFKHSVIFFLATILVFSCAGKQNKQVELLTKETDELRIRERQVASRVDELEHQVMVLQEELKKSQESNLTGQDSVGEVPSDIPVVRLKPNKRVKKSAALPKATSVKQVAKIYDRLFKKFNDGDCQETVLDFDQFSKSYPNSSLADNAQYWIAECYFRIEEYRLAIGEFRRVLSDYPQGNKVPDAFLRMGMSYAALGDRHRAKQSYEKLLKEFPQSDAAQKADAHLREMSQYGGS